MGCFSFMCKKCKTSVRSTSMVGENVHLFLLKDGVVVEQMEGGYDSYGRVFDANGDSIEWKMPWSEVCDLMFHPDDSNGIAAIHTRCYNGAIPTKRSDGDPEQGWQKVRKKHL